MVKDKLATARIPETLAKTIDEFIKSPQGIKLGFRSRADFVNTIVREYLERNVVPINVPVEIIKEIKKIIKEKKHGYRSVEDFLADAARRRLEQLKPLG